MLNHNTEEHPENDPEYKALSVNEGIDQPPSVNEDSVKRFLKKRRRRLLSHEEYVSGILDGNITILSQAVTLVESNNPDHQEIAQKVIMECLPFAGKSIRIGITGVPGAGKSTFIESLGSMITSKGGKLAVLAIDPSSERTKGSILGDKTRMENLSSNSRAYIRPSPSAGSLGGVARKTRETIVLCEAAGFDNIFIETVGVGQSETTVHSMVDFFLLIQIAGAGDELQGIKRGIMEMADVIAINKSDGENIQKANLAATQFRNALHLFPPSDSGWEPKVFTCSAHKSTGIDYIWSAVNDYISYTKESGFFYSRRQQQSRFRMYEFINNSLRDNFYNNIDVNKQLESAEKSVLNGEMSSFVAAKKLLDNYFKTFLL
jgi:LAO/AO transport system kinase